MNITKALVHLSRSYFLGINEAATLFACQPPASASTLANEFKIPIVKARGRIAVLKRKGVIVSHHYDESGQMLYAPSSEGLAMIKATLKASEK